MSPLPFPSWLKTLPKLSRKLITASSTRRRLFLWGALVALIAVAQTLLVWLTVGFENTRLQEESEVAGLAVASELRQIMGQDLQSLQSLLWNDPSTDGWRTDATELVRSHRNILRIERRKSLESQLQLIESIESPFHNNTFRVMSREQADTEMALACTNAKRLAGPAYSRSYFVPMPGGYGMEVIDLCIPVQVNGRPAGYMTTVLSLSGLLTTAHSGERAKHFEASLIDGDGSRLARAGSVRGAGVYVSDQIIDLPGATMKLRIDNSAGRPGLIPNLAIGLVVGMSLALTAVVWLLLRDGRRRAKAENALAEALAFRKAMEDSLVTGLRARDLEGRITYVNPAFCKMVGFSPQELIGSTTPPYWPEELIEEYQQRQAARFLSYAEALLPHDSPAEGAESVFIRSDGKRISCLIFEAPLVNGEGRHAGWMSAILDVSEQRRVEDLARQQQEQLAATARLATVGEMASLLSHELNQPLAAIASYATGSLNLLQDPSIDEHMLRGAIERIAKQAERAGQVIKSVHDFVRRREQKREAVEAQSLIDAVLPLVHLQARRSRSNVTVEIEPNLPKVVCDRTMVEQVLLNLTRNGMQAMEHHTQVEQRHLQLLIMQIRGRQLSFHVIDNGPGIAPEVAKRLFTPFFTTRAEGMGLGLSLCRTVIEQHGGRLTFENRSQGGAEFSFTLPTEEARPAPEQNPPLSSMKPKGAF